MALELPPYHVEVHAVPAASRADMGDAFLAAYRARGGVMRTVMQGSPGGSKVTLRIKPALLTALGGGRFALVAIEDDVIGAHVDHGAISVAYLDHRASRWRLERRWDELAWTGASGHAADSVIRAAELGAPPVVFAFNQDVNQGQLDDTGWAITLGRDAPKLLGSFPTNGELTAGDGCDFDTCGAYRFRAAIGRPTAAGAVFSVTYRGWVQKPARPAKIRFVERTNYKVRGQTLKAAPGVTLPPRPVFMKAAKTVP